MLRKLLRYDFKAVLKYWWIAALSSVVLGLGGGWCISIFSSEKELPEALYVVAVLLMIVVVLGLSAFAILSTVLIFTRFYKNFFTDEGYLTFTLPVKRSQLLNSKLIVSSTVSLISSIVIIIDIIIMIFIAFGDEIFTPEAKLIVAEMLAEISEVFGAFIFVYIIEIILLLVLLTVFSTLFLFCCITVASIIAKKAKVITAIGIYYAASSVFSFVMQMFFIFGMASINSWMYNLTDENAKGVIALIMLGIILFISIFCAVLYSIQYWMLDRKLNLS